MFGLESMEDRIGFTWVLLEGFLYIFGAGLYAVSSLGTFKAVMMKADYVRHDGQNGRIQDLLTFGGILIKYSMSWCLWQLLRISTV